jgi:uncharacterized protein (TIRG00374 family)
MKSPVAKIIKLTLSIGVGIFLIWYLQRDLTENDKQVILDSFRHVKWPAAILTIILAFSACVLRALRWELLLKPIGYSPRRLTLLCSIFVMYLANLMFPRLGEVLRCTILNTHEDIPMEKSIGTMIVERIVDVIGMATIALIALIFEFDKLVDLYEVYTLQKKEGDSWPNYFILLSIIVILIALMFTPKIKKWILKKILGLMDGVKSILQLEKPILFILYSLGIYGIYFSTTYIMYAALDGLETLNISSVFLVLTAGTLGVGLTQGGIGAFQLLVTETMESYDIPRSIGLAYSWLSWMVQTGTLIFFGFLSWIYLNLKKSNRGKKS